jgi:hypothetical protein
MITSRVMIHALKDKHTLSRSSGNKVKYARNQTSEANHKGERRNCFPKESYVSIEELVRELSHNKLGLFQPLSSFSTKAIFSTKRQDYNPHKLVAAHHNLRS